MNMQAFPAPGGGTGLVSSFGDHHMRSKELLAYEVGYRTQATDRLFVDAAAFYNRYDDLLTIEPGEPFLEASPSPPHLVMPGFVSSKMSAKTYGVELGAQWQARDRWLLSAAYGYLQMDMNLDADSRDTMSAQAAGNSPHHRLSLRSMMDLQRDLELDCWLRYSSSIDSVGLGGYVGLDVRLAWKPDDDLEVSIVGQDLLRADDPQLRRTFSSVEAALIEPGIYAKVTWGF